MHSTKRRNEQHSVTCRRTAAWMAVALAAFVIVSGCNSNGCNNNNRTFGPEQPIKPIPPAPVPPPVVVPTPPPVANVAPAQIQIESVAIELNPQEHTPQLAMRVRNTGSSIAETSGGCEWRCPAVIKQINGFLQVNQGDIVNPGQDRMLSPGGGVVNVCDGNKMPIPLSCTISVQTVDKNIQKVGAAQTIRYSQTVTPP